jgi:hypothetical protein
VAGLAAPTQTEAAPIEIRVEEASQLFDNLDPFPFRERDLDPRAEEYIVGWARELPRDRALRIVVHLPAGAANTANAADLQGALARYFDYRADIIGRELNELFRIGRSALLIGLSVLAVCLGASRMVSMAFGGEVSRFAEESLIIVGWVANWRPIEIFLYEWWPIVRRRKLYRRLAAASVEVVTDGETR